jgi:hypothetical protein
METMTDNEFFPFLIKLIHSDSAAPVMSLTQLQGAKFCITLNTLDNRNECIHAKILLWLNSNMSTVEPRLGLSPSRNEYALAPEVSPRGFFLPAQNEYIYESEKEPAWT